MNRKEEIIKTAVKLGSIKGLSNVSMSDIANEIGIKKPSLYNHFKSKDELIEAMYDYFKEKTKALIDYDYVGSIKYKTLEEILLETVMNYVNMNNQGELLDFYKVVYSQRTTSPIAANILYEETNTMINATKKLFMDLYLYNKLKDDDIPMLASTYALTIHAMMDYQFDAITANKTFDDKMITNYIKWFSKKYGD